MTALMRPIAQWQPAAPIVGLLTDIDDTLTTAGAVPAPVVDAIGALKGKGYAVIPITGRPLGWSEPFAQSWPVDALVAENGAAALRRNTQGRLDKLYQQDAATRSANFARMQQVLAHIEASVPGARRAADSVGRECDIAIDHSEFAQLPQAAIDACVRAMHDAGMNATVSSIHINGWFGEHNKWQGARWIVRALFGRDLSAETGQWCYIGDSTNDQVMFQHFANSFGVANIARFAAQLHTLPRYVTASERGAGFIELAKRLLAL